ncbi:hypothetical protein GCM10012319_56450 [Comamonas sp. KCTC 72670]|nr:hypothetical protein GCM10012319_56450 [Comamonas sp. KCTC 72670]
MPKRVQSVLNGRVFEASDFRWTLLTLNRERTLTDAEMAASPAQVQETDGLAAWARTERGFGARSCAGASGAAQYESRNCDGRIPPAGRCLQPLTNVRAEAASL